MKKPAVPSLDPDCKRPPHMQLAALAVEAHYGSGHPAAVACLRDWLSRSKKLQKLCLEGFITDGLFAGVRLVYGEVQVKAERGADASLADSASPSSRVVDGSRTLTSLPATPVQKQCAPDKTIRRITQAISSPLDWPVCGKLYGDLTYAEVEKLVNWNRGMKVMRDRRFSWWMQIFTPMKPGTTLRQVWDGKALDRLAKEVGITPEDVAEDAA